MKLANFFLMTVLVGTLGVLGCGDDTTNGGSGTAGSGGGPDPSEICNESACRTNADKKADCVTGITACIADEPEVNWDECFIGVVTIACSSV
jgi:hypothetical protein